MRSIAQAEAPRHSGLLHCAQPCRVPHILSPVVCAAFSCFTGELRACVVGRRADGDGGRTVYRWAQVERPAVTGTERFPGDEEPVSICRRTLNPDGRMVIEIKKRTPTGRLASFRAIASRC